MLLRGFAIVNKDGEVRIPLRFCKGIGIKPGDKVELKVVGGGGLLGGQIKVRGVQKTVPAGRRGRIIGGR